jgi:phosphate ABC transporter permease subunit PstA
VSTLEISRSSQRERALGGLFRAALFVSLAIGILTLAWLIASILIEGWPRLNQDVLFHFPSSKPEIAGAQSAIMGTIWVVGLTALITIPLGIGAALYLEEFADRDTWHSRLIEVNLQNLAAVPSVIYGLLAVATMAVLGYERKGIVLGGAIALSLLILPVIIIATRESVRAVPNEIRFGSLALGATTWQTTWRQILPASVPGIATGTILGLSRAIGEAAPLLLLGIAGAVRFDPTGLQSSVTALPIQIFRLSSESQEEYRVAASAAIIVLLVMILGMNALAIFIRNKFQRSW